MNPVVVYLDSQDYSNMANKKRHANEPDLPILLEELRQLKGEGKVKFVFSAVSVAEALPVKGANVSHSIRQVRLMRELCGDNALINYAQLIRGELEYLCGKSATQNRVAAGPFDWMPPALERALRLPPAESKTVREAAAAIVNASAAAKENSQLRAAGLSMATRAVRKMRLQEQRARIERGDFFYIKPQFYEVMLRACVGEASQAEKAAAFLESWNDLEWVIGLHDKLPDLSNWYRDIIRQPNAKMMGALRTLVDGLGGRQIPEEWKKLGWKGLRDKHVVELAQDACRLFGLKFPASDANRVLEMCPGLCAEQGVIWSLTWAYTTSGIKKEVQNSSAADAMHSAYAPYVDVFRTDKSIATHVSAALGDAQTRVVSDRRKLVATIEALLRERSLH